MSLFSLTLIDIANVVTFIMATMIFFHLISIVWDKIVLKLLEKLFDYNDSL